MRRCVLCAVVFVLATLLAWADQLGRGPTLSRTRRRRLAIAATVIAVAGGCAGALVATKGHPFAFISRQWNGFVHASTETVSTSNFGGGRQRTLRLLAGRLDAFLAHPIGGLGQDNFDNYYVPPPDQRRSRPGPTASR